MKLSSIIATMAVTVVSADTLRHGRNLSKSGKGGKGSHFGYYYRPPPTPKFYPRPPPKHYGPPPKFPPPQHHGPPPKFPPPQHYGPPPKWRPSHNYHAGKSGKSSKGGNFKYVWVQGPKHANQWSSSKPQKPRPRPYWGGSYWGKSGKGSKGGWYGYGKSGKGHKGGKGSWYGWGISGKGSYGRPGKGHIHVQHIWLPAPKPHFPQWLPSTSSNDWDDDGYDDDGKWEDDGHDDTPEVIYTPAHGKWEDDGHDDTPEVIYTPAPTVVPEVLWQDDGHDDDDDDGWFNDGHEVCFSKGKVVACQGPPEGDATHVEFSYSVETSGLDPEDTISDLEDAILKAAVDHVSSLESTYDVVTRVSSKPDDKISDDTTCEPKYSGHDCSIIKGGMTVYAGDHVLNACDYSNVIEASMRSADFSDIDGVKDVEYVSSDSCGDTSSIIAGEAAVVETEEGLSAGAMIGLAMLGAFVAALALLLARKLRRKPETIDNREIDLISVDTDFEGNRFGNGDPFASTVDVHKCTSMYCNCNQGGIGTKFLPAPKKSNMGKIMSNQGIDTTSPTGVDDAEAQGFFVGDTTEESEDSSRSQNSTEPKDSIIRAEPTVEDRALTPVREVAHDSEIDTEWESDGEEIESIPPPPPLPPGHPGNNSLQADEMSV